MAGEKAIDVETNGAKGCERFVQQHFDAIDHLRSFSGAVCIEECSPDGRFIRLANSSTIKDVDLTGWRLVRSVDNGREISFTLPDSFTLHRTKTVKVFAGTGADGSSTDDLLAADLSTWGVGHSVVTRLVNQNDDERAVHIQRNLD